MNQSDLLKQRSTAAVAVVVCVYAHAYEHVDKNHIDSYSNQSTRNVIYMYISIISIYIQI